MGVVYEAFDRERGDAASRSRRCARSTPTRSCASSASSARCSDLSHPNLVSLGELVDDGDAVVLHDGAGRRRATSLRWVRPRRRARRERLRAALRAARRRAGGAARARAGPPRRQAVERDGHARGPRRAARLRPRDRPRAAAQSIDGAAGRHRRYMAPEQARRRPVGAAADWYAVGVMLYEALTGALPFGGTRCEILMHKQRSSRRRRASSRPSVPADLDALCMRAARASTRRRGPSGDESLRAARRATPAPRATAPPARSRRSSGASASSPRCATRSPTRARAPTRARCCRRRVGHRQERAGARASSRELAPREPERAGARRPLLRARVGAVQGVRRRRRRAQPLAGALRRRRGCAPLLPRATGAARRAVSRCSQRVDGDRARRARPRPRRPAIRTSSAARMFAALRELLARARARAPRWCSRSTTCSGPTPTASRCSRELLRAARRAAPPVARDGARRRRGAAVELARLLGAEVRCCTLGRCARRGAPARRALARPRADGARSPLSTAVDRREAGGHPLFLHELVRHLAQRPALAARALAARRRARRARGPLLGPDAPALLEIVAVAGAPIAQEHRGGGGRLDFDDLRAHRHRVARAEPRAHVRACSPRDRVEPYHDRVREALLRRLDPATRNDAPRPPGAGARGRQAAPTRKSLASHFAEAGDRDAAAKYAGVAAEEAARALAFDRAVTLYRDALALAPVGASARARCAIRSASRWPMPAAAPRPRAPTSRRPIRTRSSRPRATSRQRRWARAAPSRRRAVAARRPRRRRAGGGAQRPRRRRHELPSTPSARAGVAPVRARARARARPEISRARRRRGAAEAAGAPRHVPVGRRRHGARRHHQRRRLPDAQPPLGAACRRAGACGARARDGSRALVGRGRSGGRAVAAAARRRRHLARRSS